MRNLLKNPSQSYIVKLKNDCHSFRMIPKKRRLGFPFRSIHQSEKHYLVILPSIEQYSP